MIRIQIKSKPTFRQASQLAGRFASQRRRIVFEELDWASLAPAIAMAVTEVFDTEGYGQWPGTQPGLRSMERRKSSPVNRYCG